MEHSKSYTPQFFKTSIWDETLYQVESKVFIHKAWSELVHSLVPNIGELEKHLRDFCRVSSSDEAVIFEKATFLEICHVELKSNPDPHRFEKMSNIIKQFKLSLM